MTLTRSASQLAAQSNRQSPTVHDVLYTYEYLGIDGPSLMSYAREAGEHSAERTRLRLPQARRETEEWADPMAEFLPSDDEDEDEEKDEKSVWKKLMNDVVPDHLPPQPPRHCWMFTPVYATQMLSELPMMQLVNRKLDNARLVETSLRRLIRETDKAALPELQLKEGEDAKIEEIETTQTSAPAPPVPSEPAKSSEPAATEPAAPAGPSPAAEPAAAPSQPEPAPDTTLTENAAQVHAPLPPVALDTKKPLLRAVNYKSSWYASLGANDSRLPSANLYTARLRGGADEGSVAKRPRRFVVQ